MKTSLVCFDHHSLHPIVCKQTATDKLSGHCRIRAPKHKLEGLEGTAAMENSPPLYAKDPAELREKEAKQNQNNTEQISHISYSPHLALHYSHRFTPFQHHEKNNPQTSSKQTVCYGKQKNNK